MPYYPVVLDYRDYLLTTIIVLVMAFLFTWFAIGIKEEVDRSVERGPGVVEDT